MRTIIALSQRRGGCVSFESSEAKTRIKGAKIILKEMPV